jgi:hypothetical protein
MVEERWREGMAHHIQRHATMHGLIQTRSAVRSERDESGSFVTDDIPKVCDNVSPDHGARYGDAVSLEARGQCRQFTIRLLRKQMISWCGMGGIRKHTDQSQMRLQGLRQGGHRIKDRFGKCGAIQRDHDIQVFTRIELLEGPFTWTQHECRNVRLAHHGFGNAAKKHMRYPRANVAHQDNQIALVFLGEGTQRVTNNATQHHRAQRDVLLAHPRDQIIHVRLAFMYRISISGL